MSTPCVPPSICPGRNQQGIVTITVLVLLVILLFMGRGLVHFVQQGARSGIMFRQEMEMRLVAESMAEKQWHSLQQDDRRLQNLRENVSVLLDSGKFAGLDYTVYGRSWGGNIYLIATAFRRDSVVDEIIEPHVMVKGVLRKEDNHYVWLGWAP